MRQLELYWMIIFALSMDVITSVRISNGMDIFADIYQFVIIVWTYS